MGCDEFLVYFVCLSLELKFIWQLRIVSLIINKVNCVVGSETFSIGSENNKEFWSSSKISNFDPVEQFWSSSIGSNVLVNLNRFT